MPLWGHNCPLLALAALTCLSLAGDGPVHSRLALLSPLFCEQAWWCLSLGLFTGVAIPGSGLLSQLSSLRLPSGHSGPVLTLSNAAHVSLPSPHLLVVQASALLLCWWSYRWAHNLWVLIIYLFFLPVMLPSVLPRLATDVAASVSCVWKLLSF